MQVTCLSASDPFAYLNSSPPPVTSSRGMNFFKKLSSKGSFKSAESPSVSGRRTPSSQIAANPIFHARNRGTATHASMEDEAPPAYSPAPTGRKTTTATVVNSAAAGAATQVPSEDSPYSFLTQFDTVFLVDDSGSMAGRSWRETCAALKAIAPICTTYDQDGVDIYFLNHWNSLSSSSSSSSNRGASLLGGYANVTTAAAVDEIFRAVRPLGGTPTGTRLNQLLKPYLAELKAYMGRQARGGTGADDPGPKPLNIIVITDGVPSDDVESVIVSAAKKLDLYNAEPWQVGIQFFQVGNEPQAAADLRELDDALSTQHGIRDMVDTIPWSGGNGAQTLTAEECLKVTMGAVNRRLDRRRWSDERRQS